METEDNSAVAGLTGDSEDESDGVAETASQNAAPKIRHKCDLYLAEGVYTDCNDILKKFLSLKTSTFEDFVTVWKERDFSAIFSGRDSYAELVEFSEEVMAIAKSFILPPNSQIKRIGAIYLMYGLYSQQPLRNSIQFRVTPEEWSVILKFVENLKAHGFIDANYIFHKMYLDGAFLTVAMTREYGLERNYRKYLMPWPARDQELDPSATFSVENLMGRVYRGSLKAAADKCRSKYSSIKKLIERQKKSSHFHGLRGTEKELDRVMLEGIDRDVDVRVESLESSKKCSNIVSGRRGIKDRAFMLPAQSKVAQCSSVTDAATSSSAPSTSQCDQNDSNTEGDILLDSESDDSDFEYMMRPPSMRNSRKIKSKKIQKQKKLQEEQEEIPPLGKTKAGRIPNQFLYKEVGGKLRDADKRPEPRKSKKKEKKEDAPVTEEETTSIETISIETTTSQSVESCPLIDINDDEVVMPGRQDTSKSRPSKGKKKKEIPEAPGEIVHNNSPITKPKRARTRNSSPKIPITSTEDSVPNPESSASSVATRRSRRSITKK